MIIAASSCLPPSSLMWRGMAAPPVMNALMPGMGIRLSMYFQVDMVDTRRFRTIGHWKLRLSGHVSQTCLPTT